MTERPWWHRALEGLGVEVHRLDDLKPKYDAAAAAEGRYIFVRNDDVSRMDLVTDWLARSFDMEKKRAAMTMIAIDRHGLGVIGPFSTEEAEHRLEKARAVAKELGLHDLVFSREAPKG